MGISYVDDEAWLLSIPFETISFLLWMFYICGKESKIISKVKIFKLAIEGPLDASMFVSSCFSHNPIANSQEDSGGEDAALAYYRLYREPLGDGIAKYNTAFKVVIKIPH